MPFDQTRVSRDLAEIILLADDLVTQAAHDASAIVDGHSLPGGLAMVSLAPVADISTWQRRAELTEHRWAVLTATYEVDGWPAGIDPTDRPDVASDEDDTWEPALQTLRFWTDTYRHVHQQDWDMIPTIATEANYLRVNLDWIVDNDPRAEHLARDINRARVRLENVLAAGRRPETTRIVCDSCDAAPQLLKVYAARHIVGYRCACGTVRDNPAEPCLMPCTAHTANPVWHSDPDDDSWKCPNSSCRKRFDLAALGRAHARQLRHSEAAKFLPQRDAIATLVAQGTSKSTIMRWLRCPIEHVEDRCTVCKRKWEPSEHNVCPGLVVERGDRVLCGGELKQIWKGDRDDVVEGYCDIATHRTYVWWPDLWTRHLQKQAKKQRTNTVAS